VIAKELLEALLRDVESDRAERTVSTTDTDKFATAITAFANDLPGHRLPGYLLIGVKDDGRLSGLTVSDRLLQNLAGIRSDGNILPLPSISVGKFTFPEGEIAVVEVEPSDQSPVRYKGQVWIRIGPRRALASEQEERRLSEKRIAGSRTFDARPCLGSNLNALALDLFQSAYLRSAVAPEVVESNHRELPVQLASLRLFDLERACPTNAGILLLAKNPLEFLPGAYIQFLRLNGDSLTSEINTEAALSGDLLNLLRELNLLLEVHLQSRPMSESILRERLTFDYPPEALREILINAVLHRSYESTAPVRFYWFRDRIEIQSPGGLYGEASPENFPYQNSYRNPVIAEIMKNLGFVNKFGRGVLRAQQVLQANGNDLAQFHFDHHYVRASFRSAT